MRGERWLHGARAGPWRGVPELAVEMGVVPGGWIMVDFVGCGWELECV